MMLTIRVPFNLSRADIVAMVAEDLMNDDPPRPTRDGITKLLRKKAHAHGYWMTAENSTEEDLGYDKCERAAAMQAADELITRFFPEMTQERK